MIGARRGGAARGVVLAGWVGTVGWACGVAGCGPADPAPTPSDSDSDSDGMAAWGPAPARVDPDQRGPYGVGTTTVIVPAEARDGLTALTVEVWYPADADGVPAPDTYALDGIRFDGTATRDAPIDPRGAPYPVIAFSHGLGGVRFQSFFLTEHLASHGWVVVAPDHPGSTLLDLDSARIPVAAVRRPQDIRDAVDAVIGGAVPGLSVAGDAYVVSGHSFGAWTSLVVGGGTLDLAGIDTACASVDRPGCRFFEGERPPAADLARWAQPDPRATVTIAMAPGVWYAFGADGAGLQGVRRPMVLGGTRDGDLPYDDEILPTFEALGAPKVHGALVDAGHWVFSDLCAILPVEDCAGAAKGYMEPARAQALTRTRVLAFARSRLLGMVEDEAWLIGDTDLAWTDEP